jgi:hypothetical protein
MPEILSRWLRIGFRGFLLPTRDLCASALFLGGLDHTPSFGVRLHFGLSLLFQPCGFRGFRL